MEQDDNFSTMDKIQGKISELLEKLKNKETFGGSISERKFRAMMTMLAEGVSSSFFEHWGRKNLVIASSYRNGLKSFINDDEHGVIEKADGIRDSPKEKKSTEKNILYQEQEVTVTRSYVEAMGKAISLQIRLEDSGELINELESVLRDYEHVIGCETESTEKVNDDNENRENIEDQESRTGQNSDDTNLKYYEQILYDLLEAKERILKIFETTTEEMKQMANVESEKIHEELRYTSEEILYIYRIILSSIRQQECIIEENEWALDKTSKIELRIRQLLAAKRFCSQIKDSQRKVSRKREVRMEKWEILKPKIPDTARLGKRFKYLKSDICFYD